MLEVQTAPAVPRLYFWALQVGFSDLGRDLGAAHTGLQWHPAAPAGAVNWGGYGPGGELLDGSTTGLPEADGPNTRHYALAPARPYRLRVFSPAPGTWRSEVTDLVTGLPSTVRDLYVAATGLVGPVVWSEVFADCDDPPVRARWSGAVVVTQDGTEHPVLAARPTYQERAQGGCDNTQSFVEGDGFVQASGLQAQRPPVPPSLVLDLRAR